MAVSWSSFEDKVRAAASSIYNAPCTPKNIGGVDIDGVIILSDDVQIFIEMTVQRELGKVRDDVTKLNLARSAYLAAHQSYPRCYCVVNGPITRAMKDAGAPLKINVLSFGEFSSIFFDFEKYRHARTMAAFSSAINPRTGAKDEREYVPVSYQVDATQKEIVVADIARMLGEGRKIVLLGEYGTGKSRCTREVFGLLAETATQKSLYPLAFDLRDFWGLQRAPELITRHFSDLGLDAQLQHAAVRALNAERTVLLLDGFDELGSQAWSNDSEKLRAIRSKSLAGVKDLISRGKKGVLITGREHYFNNNEDMFSALGLAADDSIVVRCKDEFTDAEMREFFRRYVTEDIVMPDWLPRRPLVCQTIADMDAEELDQMFGVGQDELGFFDHFISVLCQRDARIRASFDAVTIEAVLRHLARLTRTRSANVGPITLSNVQAAFEAVVGQMPVEEASLMLQRLPALGRVKAETNDRQFIDIYILDGLRAKDSGSLFTIVDRSLSSVFETAFANPLDEFGQRILARDVVNRSRNALEVAKRAASAANRVLACDVVAAFLRTGMAKVDFERLSIRDGNFLKLDFTATVAESLNISDTVFGTLVLPASVPPNTTIKNSLAERVIGVSSPTALPAWIEDLHADRFDSTESISRIRQIGLDPPHEILATIIRKTFFQKGAGRKEEALLRGLGQLAEKGMTGKILNLLLAEDILERFKGSEGLVYTPNRKHAGRMRKMLYELKTSQDPIWKAASNL